MELNKKSSSFKFAILILLLGIVVGIGISYLIEMEKRNISGLVSAELELPTVDDFGNHETEVVKITTSKELKWIERSMSWYWDGMGEPGGCGYDGILTLVNKDGNKIIYQFATDSCGGFMLPGSDKLYSLGSRKEKALFKLFGKVL